MSARHTSRSAKRAGDGHSENTRKAEGPWTPKEPWAKCSGAMGQALPLFRMAQCRPSRPVVAIWGMCGDHLRPLFGTVEFMGRAATR
mmetsp:Transcript_82450/g.137921  ORF Transcript_82450/g.137921 Transcript_82450/m.137921 type:complete len:87 (-) Transcript_82450:2011-2271(-)